VNTPELFIVGTFVSVLVSAGIALPLIGSFLDRRAARTASAEARATSRDIEAT
jgi:hypothetical protein